MLKRLLEYYIKNELCSNLTGIGKNRQASTSLLHCAMDKGTDCSQFLEMCFECGKPGLLVYDKKGRTPWYYLMNHKDPKILESVLCTLKKHNIDVNKLITDKHSGSTMLHLAYRKQRQECIKLLEDAGADPGKKDAGGVRADKRDHCIEGSQKRCREQVTHDQQQHNHLLQSENLGRKSQKLAVRPVQQVQREEPATANAPTKPRSQRCQITAEEPATANTPTKPKSQRCQETVESPATANAPTKPRSQQCQITAEEPATANAPTKPRSQRCQITAEEPATANAPTKPRSQRCQITAEEPATANAPTKPRSQRCQITAEEPATANAPTKPRSQRCQITAEEPATANAPTKPRSQRCQITAEEPATANAPTKPRSQRCQITAEEPATANAPTKPRSQQCQMAVEETIDPNYQSVLVCSNTSSKSMVSTDF